MLTRDELRVAVANQQGARFVYFNATRTALRLKHFADERGDETAASLCAKRAFDLAERGRARALMDLLATDDAADERLLAARRIHARIATWQGLLRHALESPSGLPVLLEGGEVPAILADVQAFDLRTDVVAGSHAIVGFFQQEMRTVPAAAVRSTANPLQYANRRQPRLVATRCLDDAALQSFCFDAELDPGRRA